MRKTDVTIFYCDGCGGRRIVESSFADTPEDWIQADYGSRTLKIKRGDYPMQFSLGDKTFCCVECLTSYIAREFMDAIEKEGIV